MSGHSKWSTIKHKKQALDNKRGKIFSKIVREIMVAAKGNADPETNPRLRTIIAKAKSVSMPAKNIDNAIKKSSGDKSGAQFIETSYEGYGPFGVAFFVECLTDNKNRTVADVRAAFTKNGGSLGENGSVAWQFSKKGIINIAAGLVAEEALLEKVLEAGGEDLISEADGFTIISDQASFYKIEETLREAKIEISHAEVAMVAHNFVAVSKEQEEKINKISNILDDLDDVVAVSSNEKTE